MKVRQSFARSSGDRYSRRSTGSVCRCAFVAGSGILFGHLTPVRAGRSVKSSTASIQLYLEWQQALARYGCTDYAADLLLDLTDALGISLLEPEGGRGARGSALRRISRCADAAPAAGCLSPAAERSGGLKLIGTGIGTGHGMRVINRFVAATRHHCFPQKTVLSVTCGDNDGATVIRYSNWFANRSLLWPNRGCRAVSCFSRW